MAGIPPSVRSHAIRTQGRATTVPKTRPGGVNSGARDPRRRMPPVRSTTSRTSSVIESPFATVRLRQRCDQG
jgi:hypothetical protein